MCFEILVKNKKYNSARIAKRDIVCYKILSLMGQNGVAMYVSPFQYAQYFDIDMCDKNIHVIKNSEIKIMYGGCSIAEGLHTYSDLNEAKEEASYLFHENKVFKSIIPAGATYYYNPETKVYVSNKLSVYTKPIK